MTAFPFNLRMVVTAAMVESRSYAGKQNTTKTILTIDDYRASGCPFRRIATVHGDGLSILPRSPRITQSSFIDVRREQGGIGLHSTNYKVQSQFYVSNIPGLNYYVA